MSFTLIAEFFAPPPNSVLRVCAALAPLVQSWLRGTGSDVTVTCA